MFFHVLVMKNVINYGNIKFLLAFRSSLWPPILQPSFMNLWAKLVELCPIKFVLALLLVTSFSCSSCPVPRKPPLSAEFDISSRLSALLDFWTKFRGPWASHTHPVTLKQFLLERRRHRQQRHINNFHKIIFKLRFDFRLFWKCVVAASGSAIVGWKPTKL